MPPIQHTKQTNGMLTQRQLNNFLRTDGMRAMTGDLNMNTRRILNLRQPQSYAVHVGFLKKELSSSNANLQTIIHNEYKKYVSDRFILCQVQIRKTCQQYLVDNPSS